MCGIYGWDLSSINISDDQRGLLAIALGRYNDTRGGHSWGALTDLRDVHKGLGDIEPVSLDFATHSRVAAHTRWATHGDRTIANAHPFTLSGRTGVVVGAHNGVIYNHTTLNAKYDRDFAVDSMHIFQNIADGQGIDDLEGYGTIWWRMDDELYLCQMNDSGDLSVYGLHDPRNDEAHGVVFSSDDTHLVRALTDAGLMHMASAYCVEPGVVYVVRNELYRTKMRLNLERGKSTLRWSDYNFGSYDLSDYSSRSDAGFLDSIDGSTDDLTPLDADKAYDFDSNGYLVGVYVIDPDNHVEKVEYSSVVSTDEDLYRVYVTSVEAEEMIKCAIAERWSLEDIIDTADSYGEFCVTP